MIAEPLVNLTTVGRRRSSIEVAVAYGTDLARATEVLRAAVAGVDEVLDQPAAEVWVSAFDESGITVTAMFWHAPQVRDQLAARHAVAVSVHEALRSDGITIPFPQRVIHLSTNDRTPAS